MELIKRHKGLAIVGGLSVVLFIVMFIIVARMLFSSGKSEYGDRLNGLVKIDSGSTEKLKTEIGAMEEVEKVNVRVQGKIIYVEITFTEATSRDKAKEIANKTLDYYNEEVINYYDFGYILSQNKEVNEGEEDTSFVIAGTKHPDSDHISYTNG